MLGFIHSPVVFMFGFIQSPVLFFLRTWSNEPDMPTSTAYSGVAPTSGRLFSAGGYHPRNTGPWPTEHIYSDAIAVMDYKTVLTIT